MSAFVVGVDGCRADWLACRLDTAANSILFCIYQRFDELLDAEKDAATIAIDIPIGLRDDWTPRSCDLEARKLLGRRSSSIFPAPPRSLLKANSYQAALDTSRRKFNRGLSRQTYNLFRKIDEVDAVLRANHELPVFEAHPELCFRLLKKDDLKYSKKTREGYEERRGLLQSVCGLHLPSSRDWRSDFELRGKQVNRDDLLDAAVAAATAKQALRGEATLLPITAEIDAFGVRMQMFC